MKLLFFIIPLLLLLLNVNLFQDSFAEIERGINYDKEILQTNPDGTQKIRLEILTYNRILDDSNVFQDSIFTAYNDYLKLDTGHGSIKLDKSTCSFDYFNSRDDQTPLFTDSIVPKIATNGTENFSIVNSINNATCETYGSKYQLVAKKYSANVGFIEYKYILNGGSFKTQLEVTNLSGVTNKKFGFTQTINLNRDTIKYGDVTKNLDDFNGTTFDRNWLENHNSKIINLLNNYAFYFDKSFDNLKSIDVYDTGLNKSKLSFNYLYNTSIILPNETLIIDPTITQSSGGAMNNMEGGAGGGTQTRDAIKLGASSALINKKITSISFWIKKTLSPTGAIDVKIRDNVDTVRASSITALDASALTTSFVKRTFNFNSITLVALDKITLEFTGGDGSNYITDEGDGGDPYDGANTFLSNYSPSSWTDNTAYDHKFELVYTTMIPPWAVTTLTSLGTTQTTASLDWTEPYLGGGAQALIGYQINKTTPWGIPTVLVNDTGTSTSAYTATGLILGTNYSFRVSAWTNNTNNHPFNNATGNILNVTTSLNQISCCTPALTASSSSATSIQLNWTASALQNLRGYKIERETPVGGGWSTLVSNTTNTNLTYTNSPLTSNIIYNYRVYGLNGTGQSLVSNTYAMTTFHKPNAIHDLTGIATSLSVIDLTWSAPTSYAPSITGYMINYTTPVGNPQTIFTSTPTIPSATVTGLSVGLPYSFRVSAITVHGTNATGKIFNTTTTTTYELGNLPSPDITNTNDFSIFYNRTNYNATRIYLDVTYPDSYNMDCNFLFKFSRANNTYANLAGTPITGPGADTNNERYRFIIDGVNDEIINIRCWDTITDTEAKYIITITDFELLHQIANLHNGTYGTMGQIGGIDIVMLIVVILGMIGFNRVTPVAGVIFTVITVGALSILGIIEIYQIVFPFLALVVLWAFTRTRQE